jgi:hypothetical protein
MSSVPYIFAGNTGNIPLSQLDQNFANVKGSSDYVIANAQANITSVGTLTSLSVSGNVRSGGNLSVTGNVTTGRLTTNGNISTTGVISASGNITGSNLNTAGQIFATSDINGANFNAVGNINGTNLNLTGLATVVGNVTAGNFVTAGSTVTEFLNVNQDAAIFGNILISGNAIVNGNTTFIDTQNLSVTDKNITIANGVSTSALIDGAGINAGNPTVAYIRYSNATVGWGTANNFNIGGNLTVGGVGFATTVANGNSSSALATTQFVGNTVDIAIAALGTMSVQNASNVNITGGSIVLSTPLPANSGGTGTNSLAANAILLGNGSSSVQTVAPGTAGNTLISDSGTWISQAVPPNLAFGISQTWQNLTSSRSISVTYTNTTSRPIFVVAQVGNQTNGVQVYIDSELVVRHWYDVNGGAGQIGYSTGEFMVAPGSTYRVEAGPLQGWWEYR